MKFGNVEYSAQRVEGGITYTIAAGAQEGDAVTLTGTATMGRGADADVFVGKLAKLEADGLGTVEAHGVITVPCVAGLAAGWQPLVVDGAGKVKAAAAGAAGRQALVIGVADDMAVIDLP